MWTFIATIGWLLFEIARDLALLAFLIVTMIGGTIYLAFKEEILRDSEQI